MEGCLPRSIQPPYGLVMAFPVTQRFLDAIRSGSYIWVAQADVYYSGNFIQTVPLNDGSITIDSTANLRPSCSVTVGDPNFIPLYAASALAPYGTELRIFMGVQFPDESQELVPMGIFEVYAVQWNEADGVLPVVTGYDYGKRIDD